MRTLLLLLPGLLVLACGSDSETSGLPAHTASLAPEPLPPLPGDAAGDDLVVRTDSGSFELIIDGELPREGGYVKALELRLAVVHGKGLEEDSRFESGIFVGDFELMFKNGRLFLGKNDYGECHLPTKIRISRKGVVIDGKQRGDLASISAEPPPAQKD